MILIFDVDGTLVDSRKRHETVLKKILEEQKISYDPRLIENFVEFKSNGFNTKVFLKEILNMTDEMSTSISTKWQNNIENSVFLEEDVLYSDVKEVLKSLYNKHEIIFLTARKNSANVLAELKKLGIFELCHQLYVVDPSDAKNNKMDIVKQLLHGNNVVMIGDTENEAAIANELGITKYILNRGFRSKNFFRNRNIETYDDLSNIEEVIND